MWNFNFSLCLLGIASFAGAAEVSFVGQNKLSGELISMDQDGTVTLNTPYSLKPLKIKPDGIAKIHFNTTSSVEEIPQQSLTLINGDSFPVKVESLDETGLSIQSPTLGNRVIPRDMISTLHIGKFSGKSVYRGPANISEWKFSNPGLAPWKVESGVLFSDGRGLVYRDVGLPENYSIRFKVKWDASPNFECSFSDPMDYDAASVNRYFFRINSGGMAIRRESTARQRFFPIATIERRPTEFTDNEVWVEIKVNRKSGRIALYLNDRLEGKYNDTNADKPIGTGVSFSAYASVDNKISISDIEISESQDTDEKPRVENRGDTKEDAVVVTNGERSSGRIISISNTDKGMSFNFKSKFQENPVDLPEKDISTVFFALKPNPQPIIPTGTRLNLQGRGAIQISKCVFSDQTIQITHPLLGDIELKRDAVSSIERTQSTPSNTSTIK